MIFDTGTAQAVLSAFAATQAVIRFKPDGTIVEANAPFLAAMEVDHPTDIFGKHHRIFVSHEYVQTEEYQEFWPRISRGEVQQGEFCRRTLKGNEIWISATYTPVRDATGTVAEVVKFAVDITEQRVAADAVTDALIRLAAGDITVRLGNSVRGRFSDLRTTFNLAATDLEETMRGIMDLAERASFSAEALQDNAGALAKKTDEQSAALQRTSAALKSIAAKTRATSEGASAADDHANEAHESAVRGGDIVRQTIDAIGSIEEVTREVSKITKIIEGFAFQTNLLSINAAVEAARAGDAGKGFAVVATEVRSLAQRSAEASKSIRALTRRCEADVARGAELAESAGVALEQIGLAVATVVGSVREIASANQEQATDLTDVEESTSTLEGSLRTLSGLSGDGATHSAALSDQLQGLNRIVGRFSTRAETEIRPPADERRISLMGG